MNFHISLGVIPSSLVGDTGGNITRLIQAGRGAGRVLYGRNDDMQLGMMI